MIRWFVFLFCAAPLLTAPHALAAPKAGKKRLTLEQASGRGERVSFSANPRRYRWNEAGQLVTGRGDDLVAIDPRTRRQVEPARGSSDEPGDAAFLAALSSLDGVDEDAAGAMLRSRFERADDGSSALFARDGKLYLAHADGRAAVLDPGPGPDVELARLSPDGEKVAFVRGNDLYVWSGGEARALSDDGGEDRFCGKLDWVYQEEIYGRGDFQGHFWSPDSRHIAFLVLDESPVYEFTVVDHIERGHFRVEPEVTHYPKAGDPNPIVAVRIADVESGDVVEVDLSAWEEDEPLVVRVGFAPDGSKALITIQDRIQTYADLCAVDPETGALERWIHEENDSWVNRPDAPRFLADGSFLWLSERTDHRHVYRYDAKGRLMGAVTSGDWSVIDIDAVDEERGLLWFSANKDGAVNRNLYRIGLDGEGLKRLTSGDGTHSWSFDPERRYFLDTVSSLATLPEVRLCSAEGEVLEVLDRAECPALDEYETSAWELHEIEARDGFKLDVALLKPAPFSRNKRYPVWIPTYSGPDAPSVRNRWNESAWYRFLAQQGFVVMQVNVRTASGKGHYAIEQCYKQLGVQELMDLEDAVGWLCRNRWADEKRVGITGYSYGGFMTAYALTHSDRFALGIAGGGVYDWRMYDTIYTERYMSTPQKNPEGYERTSVIGAAENLRGHLLIHHGVMDDNVHVQNAMQLAYALQRAGKQFEFMLYPQARHGVRDPNQRWHLRQLEWNVMQRVLKNKTYAM